MKVEVKIDGSCREPHAVIYADRMSPEVDEAVKKLSAPMAMTLAGFSGSEAVFLDLKEVERFYAEAGKVIACTENGRYTVRKRLYELEAVLPPQEFVRISNNEILRLKAAVGFDLSLAGTIRVKLKDGSSTYVSRRCVRRIKDMRGI